MFDTIIHWLWYGFFGSVAFYKRLRDQSQGSLTNLPVNESAERAEEPAEATEPITNPQVVEDELVERVETSPQVNDSTERAEEPAEVTLQDSNESNAEVGGSSAQSSEQVPHALQYGPEDIVIFDTQWKQESFLNGVNRIKDKLTAMSPEDRHQYLLKEVIHKTQYHELMAAGGYQPQWLDMLSRVPISREQMNQKFPDTLPHLHSWLDTHRELYAIYRERIHSWITKINENYAEGAHPLLEDVALLPDVVEPDTKMTLAEHLVQPLFGHFLEGNKEEAFSALNPTRRAIILLDMQKNGGDLRDRFDLYEHIGIFATPPIQRCDQAEFIKHVCSLYSELKHALRQHSFTPSINWQDVLSPNYFSHEAWSQTVSNFYELLPFIHEHLAPGGSDVILMGVPSGLLATLIRLMASGKFLERADHLLKKLRDIGDDSSGMYNTASLVTTGSRVERPYLPLPVLKHNIVPLEGPVLIRAYHGSSLGSRFERLIENPLYPLDIMRRSRTDWTGKSAVGVDFTLRQDLSGDIIKTRFLGLFNPSIWVAGPKDMHGTWWQHLDITKNIPPALKNVMPVDVAMAGSFILLMVEAVHLDENLNVGCVKKVVQHFLPMDTVFGFAKAYILNYFNNIGDNVAYYSEEGCHKLRQLIAVPNTALVDEITDPAFKVVNKAIADRLPTGIGINGPTSIISEMGERVNHQRATYFTLHAYKGFDGDLALDPSASAESLPWSKPGAGSRDIKDMRELVRSSTPGYTAEEPLSIVDMATQCFAAPVEHKAYTRTLFSFSASQPESSVFDKCIVEGKCDFSALKELTPGSSSASLHETPSIQNPSVIVGREVCLVADLSTDKPEPLPSFTPPNLKALQLSSTLAYLRGDQWELNVSVIPLSPEEERKSVSLLLEREEASFDLTTLSRRLAYLAGTPEITGTPEIQESLDALQADNLTPISDEPLAIDNV